MPFVNLDPKNQNPVQADEPKEKQSQPIYPTLDQTKPQSIQDGSQTKQAEYKPEEQDGVRVISKPFINNGDSNQVNHPNGQNKKQAEVITSTSSTNTRVLPNVKQDSVPVTNENLPSASSAFSPALETNKQGNLMPEPVVQTIASMDTQKKYDAVGQKTNENSPSIPTVPKDVSRNDGILSTGFSENYRPKSTTELRPADEPKDIEYCTKIAVEKDASDIHISVGYPIYFRVDGHLEDLDGKPLTEDQVMELVNGMLDEEQKKALSENNDIDFMFINNQQDRFRVNVFHEDGEVAAALRLIPKKVRTIDELGLPQILKDFAKLPYGLVVVTGPTGSGKSTTIASIIEEVNRTDAKHIITIEDPVEYVYEKNRALIAQREMYRDTKGWKEALRSVLRQDPNIVLIGEMRDHETIASALTIAETGHLVFATLHTNNAAQTVDRIIDVFPAGQQNQIRTQLSNMLSGIISQRLIPVKGGGRKAAMEILIATTAVKNAIRENKNHQIDNIIQTSSDIGMQSLEKALVDLIRQGFVDIDTAKNFTVKPDEIDLLLR